MDILYKDFQDAYIKALVEQTERGIRKGLEMEEKKVKVVIIGSTHASKEDMELAESIIRANYGWSVIYNAVDLKIQTRSLSSIQRICIDAIAKADLVLAVPKSISFHANGSTVQEFDFGESTTYEINFAKHLGIPVMYFTDLARFSSPKIE